MHFLGLFLAGDTFTVKAPTCDYSLDEGPLLETLKMDMRIEWCVKSD